MGALTTTWTRVPAVEDPETGTVYESDGDRLTVRHACACGTVTEGTAVLYDLWDAEFREDVLTEVIQVVLEEHSCD